MEKSLNSGIQNEIEFSEALNNREYSKLSDNAARFIKQLYPQISNNTLIFANKIGGKGLKPDVIVSVCQDDTNISIKKGSGNSVHQEKISLFLLYCKETLNMSNEVRDSFLAYLYGDGTLDGKGQLCDRLDGHTLQNTYKNEIENIKLFIKENARPLIERFLVYGRRGKELNIKADYLYHGNINNGVWCPLDETVDYLVQKVNSNKNSLSIGPLTIQTWNRNLSGKPELEDRRHSIQIKWGGKIKEDIQTINEIYLEKIAKNPNLLVKKIFGDNSHGFKNVKEIEKGLNGLRVRNLRGALLNLINTVFSGIGITEIVNCKIIKNAKPDLLIEIGKKAYNISIFIGSGNSVHQENFIDFVSFCREEFNMTEEEENALKLVYYGDGTIDGTGKIENRLATSKCIKEAYKDEVRIAQAFFDKNRRKLAERFLVTGKYLDSPKADFIFYGDTNNGISMPYKDILDYIEQYKDKKNGLLSIGPLSFQMWNRNLSANPKTEYKRNSIQIKWPSIEKHLVNAFSILKKQKEQLKFRYVNAEYELVSFLNKTAHQQDNILWNLIRKELNIQEKNVYAVRVCNQVYSEYLEQKIYPKSDVYLCHANITNDLLEEIGYELDENVIKEHSIKIDPILGSGISCKIPTSNNFTYAKMSINNFVKICKDIYIAVGACFFVNKNDLSLNKEILKAYNISIESFFKYINSKIGLKEYSNIEDLNINEWKEIKQYSTKAIKDLIKENQEICDKFFLGKGLYDDPYFAPFIFSKGELKINQRPDSFNITTGSGRHKGIYTIVIKP